MDTCNMLVAAQFEKRIKSYELAKLLGISGATFCTKRNNRTFKQREIDALLDRFECTYEELFGE